MVENTLSGNLERIKAATDSIRTITDTTNDTIENVAQAVSDLNDESLAKDQEIADLEDEIERITPKGTVNITNNGIINVASYQYADVDVPIKVPPIQVSSVSFDNFPSPIYDIDLSRFDPANLWDVWFGCDIESIDLSVLNDFPFVRRIGFNSCNYLRSITFPFLTDMYPEINVVNMPNLETIDASNIYINEDIGEFYLNHMFSNLPNIMLIDVRNICFTAIHWDGGVPFENVNPKCLVIVKNSEQKEWLQINCPDMINVQTVEEYEGGNE